MHISLDKPVQNNHKIMQLNKIKIKYLYCYFNNYLVYKINLIFINIAVVRMYVICCTPVQISAIQTI